ncbi:MAG: cobalt-zinc-cadmium efflux system outer membrane protein [Sulfurimonas sp.]|jgi:cobalt-zinc-cadmium efflux system outer membrane protein|uniref:TolC family protein n=1 Tax=Sulfurimonas sp. TaxID=2022749 RepID=UPI0039E2873E
MKRILLLSIFVALNLSANNLSQIIKSVQTSSKSKAILEKLKSDIAQNELSQSYDAPSLNASVSHADSIPSDAKDGIEYAVGISQDISHPFSRSLNDTSVQEYTKAMKQEAKHKLHILELEIISAYHSTCISKEMSEKSLLLYQQQSKRYYQVKTAYELGEISKKDLLFNKLDLSKLQKNVNAYKRAYLSEFSSLQERVDNLKIDSLECNDLVLPRKHIVLNAIDEHGELKVLQYQKNATQALSQLYDSPITSLGYELGYEKELDTRRYTFGINIPLGGLSSQKEKLKAEQLALSSSYEYEKEATKAQIQNYSNNAVATLELLFNEFQLLENEILPLNKELLSLSKLALLEGEGDIMEYIDASRSYSLNLIEMLETKKKYYYELFELYKKADLELGEKACVH